MSALWIPDQKTITSSNLQAFINRVKEVTGLPLENYSDLYRWSIEDRPAFWQLLSELFRVQFNVTSPMVINFPIELNDSLFIFKITSINNHLKIGIINLVLKSISLQAQDTQY